MLISEEHSASFHENSTNRHTPFIRLSRGNSSNHRPRALASKETHCFRTCKCGSRPTKSKIEPPGKSRDKELLWNSRERSFCKTRNTDRTQSKINREKHKEKWAKKAREKEIPFCSAGQDPGINKICKSLSRTKARVKRQQSTEGLPDHNSFRSSLQVPLKHSFGRISRSL